MTNIKFDGEFEQISLKQLNFIKETLQKQGYDKAHVEILAVGKPGDNYAANVKRIVAKTDDKVLRMFAKLASASEDLREAVNVNKIFGNEHIMYVNMLPLLNALEDEVKIPQSEKYKYAFCYGALLEEPHEIILIEDLEPVGFETLGKFKYFTDHEVKLVLKELAKLHSFSFYLKHQKPETFNDIKRKLYNVVLELKSDFDYMFVQLKNNTEQMLEKEAHKKALNKAMNNCTALYKHLMKSDNDSRYSVIQHGDLWSNNIMFKLENGEPTQCIMIDYQISRINSPIVDVQYMLFTCTDYETRKKHYHDWIDYYHSNLDNCLSEFGLNAKYVYPRDQLDADLKRHGRVSLCSAILNSALILQEGAAAAEVSRKLESGQFDEIMEKTNTNMTPEYLVLFKNKVEGIIESFIEYELL